MSFSTFRLALELQGFPYAAAQRKLIELQEECAQDRNAYRDKYLARIKSYHRRHNPFYARLDNELGEDFMLTKQLLQQPLEQRLSATAKKPYRNKTSGSSGIPFSFAISRDAHALSWANIKSLYRGHGINIDLDLQARFYGMPSHGFSRYKELAKDQLGNRRRFPVFDLSDAGLEKMIRQLQAGRFKYLNGYTSVLVQLAKYTLDNHLPLIDLVPTLRCCIVTSEQLHAGDRWIMEQAFGVPVLNEYGASEVGVIAFEDSAGDLVVSQEVMHVQVVDDAGNDLPDGTVGNVLITSYFNTAHPFIRYAIGDRAALGLNRQGQRIITQLGGRESDMVLLRNGGRVPGLALYYVTKAIMDQASHVREFVVHQKGYEHFILRYASDQDLSVQDHHAIKKAMNEYVGSNLQVTYERSEQLQRSERGKLMQFTRSKNLQES